MITKCLKCGKEFITYPSWKQHGSGKHCSRKCAESERYERFCNICGKKFLTTQERIENNRGKFCSKPCFYKSRIGVSAWNKGKPYPQMIGNKHRLGKSNLNPHIMLGEDNPKWKGDGVGYFGLHVWVRTHLGRPDTCEFCKKTGLKGKQIHWANKSGNYLRDITDWIRLCAKCHGAYDKERGFRKRKVILINV